MLCFNLFYFTQNMDKNSPRDAGLKKEGRTEGMLSVGSGSGLPPASAAPPEPGGAEWTPLRLLDPQDRPPPQTQPNHGPGQGASSRAPQVGLRSEIHTQGRATWKCILGAEISLAADRLKPRLSPVARRGLCLWLECQRRVWTRSQGGDVSHA